MCSIIEIMKWIRKHLNIIGIIGIFLTLLSLWFAYYLSGPLNLEIWHNISEEESRLYIYGRNNDMFRSSGTIDIFRIEVSPYKPHMQLEGNDTLKPGESKQIASLIIRINESKETIISDSIWKSFTIPASLIYFITEDTSISYKIVCDTCKPQGIVKRIPDMSTMNPRIILDPKENQVRLTVPVYSWETKKLEDLYELFPVYEK